MSCAGILVIVVSTLNIINIQELINIVRNIWNCIFGTLMILLQLNWKQMMTRNFGFLNNWVLRALFYIFVGTNIMNDSSLLPSSPSLLASAASSSASSNSSSASSAPRRRKTERRGGGEEEGGNAVDPGGVSPSSPSTSTPTRLPLPAAGQLQRRHSCRGSRRQEQRRPIGQPLLWQSARSGPLSSTQRRAHALAMGEDAHSIPCEVKEKESVEPMPACGWLL